MAENCRHRQHFWNAFFVTYFLYLDFLTGFFFLMMQLAIGQNWLTPNMLASLLIKSIDEHKCWRHEMDWLSALLALCVGNPWVIGGFPSQRTSAANLMFLQCLPDQTVEQTLECPVIWHDMTLISYAIAVMPSLDPSELLYPLFLF